MTELSVMASSAMRVKIAQSLPEAFDAAIQSYQSFFAQDHSESAKSFSAHHSACKAAIAHLQLLIKLADWVEEEAPDNELENLREIRAKAEAELSKTSIVDYDAE